MRIGFFTDNYLPRADGIAFSVESFRAMLEAHGHEVYIFAPKPSLRFKEPSPRVIRFPAIKGLFYDDYLTSFFFPPQVARKIDKLQLDIIHFHVPSQVGLLGAQYALHNNIPLVTTYHTDLYEYVKHYPQVLPGVIALSMVVPAITGGGINEFISGLSSIKPERSINRWNQKLVQNGMTMIHNHCDAVIAPSRKIEQQLLSWHTTSRVVTLQTGVDKITTTNKDIAEVRRKYELAVTAHVILFVGRIGTEKNLSLLIKAFEIIAHKDPLAHLVIVGTGEDIGTFKLEAAATKYNSRIIFTGTIDRSKLGSYYAIAQVFAFPSLTDTQGLVLNEAARASLPIVMIDRNVSDVVMNGKNGYYARNTAKDFANRITTILSDSQRRQRMGEKSAELAEGYSVELQTQRLELLYAEVMANHKPRQKPKHLARLHPRNLFGNSLE